jgi:hypothetical protein
MPRQSGRFCAASQAHVGGHSKRILLSLLNMLRRGSLLLFAAAVLAAAEDFPCRSGKFVVIDASIDQRTPQKTDSSLMGSFAITVTLRNETGEDWRKVPLDVDIFEQGGRRLGAGSSPHTFTIGTSIRSGEQKAFVVNRALPIQKPVKIGKFRVSLSPEAAQSMMVDPGKSAAFLAADLSCATQFRETLQTGGPELKKRLTDLVIYRCGVLFDYPSHAFVRDRKPPYAEVEVLEGVAQGRTGWVPEIWLK